MAELLLFANAGAWGARRKSSIPAVSISKRIVFGGLASWFSRGVTIALNLLVMPVLFAHLSKEELGVWLLLGQSCAVLGVFDLGFGIVLTRRIALAYGKGGARKALSEGTIKEIADLAETGKCVYRWLALFAFASSFGLGAFYLGSLELRGVSVTSVWVAWGVLCASQAFAVWAAVWTCLLQGVGYVGWDTVFGSVVSSLALLLQILLLFLGGGIVSLAVVAAAGSLMQRALMLSFARNRLADLFAKGGRWRRDLLRQMISPAFRAWLTSLGYLLVANTDQFFIAADKGASAIPAYRAALLLIINLHLLAGVFCAPSQVFVSHFWQAGDLRQVRAILRRNALIGLLAMGCGAGAILALGPSLFELWVGPGNFVGYPILGIFLATFILEHHANVFSSCGRATEDEAYAVSSIASGLAKLALAWVLTARFGLLGLAVSTLVAQCLTNYWFMVYRSAKRVGVHLGEHLREVLVPSVLVFCMTLGPGLWADHVLHENRALIRVGVVSMFAGALLIASFWRLVLDESQRARVCRQLRFA